MHYIFYRYCIRPIFFLFDSEKIHHFVCNSLHFIWQFALIRKCTRWIFSKNLHSQPIQLATLNISNPIGLAAGFDKNAFLVPGIETLGFGFIEIGTITPLAQSGNEKPRLFRLKEKNALLNRMGFNNDGADVIFERLQKIKHLVSIPIGINIGKNKNTPNENALSDYHFLLKKFKPIADYFTINVSSPNTQGLRELQSKDFIEELSVILKSEKILQPVFLKLAPELDTETLKMLCSYCGADQPITGLILTNTIATDLGGISGQPLKEASLNMLKTAKKILPNGTPIISVGGIESEHDVIERLQLGATAVQIYTSLIYNGPSLVKKLVAASQRYTSVAQRTPPPLQ